MAGARGHSNSSARLDGTAAGVGFAYDRVPSISGPSSVDRLPRLTRNGFDFMHFHKQPSPLSLAPIDDLKVTENTVAADGQVVLSNAAIRVAARALDGGLFELTINRETDPLPRHTPGLAHVPAADARATCDVTDQAVHLRTSNGVTLTLATAGLQIGLAIGGDDASIPLIELTDQQIIGFSGEKFGIGLPLPAATPFYGFGEKTGPLNKHGQRMKFWNLDVCSDMPHGCQSDSYDPAYCAIPVAIWPVAAEDGSTRYVAVLIDNSGPAWFNCQTPDFKLPDLLYFGTYCGEPRFYIITGDTMGEVCAKLQRLTGTPPLPPLWSLGNQQCRWGYDEQRMYQRIVDHYAEEHIPLHGFWLDIDYMDRYKVFTWHEKRVPSPQKLSQWMSERGVRMVTIVDPGVAIDENDALYQAGCEQDLFCRAPSGRHFVGMVWPGQTVFPDFSLPETRQWWADQVAQHLARGVHGIWNDMNDPATGMCDVDDMLFDRGAIRHDYLHNLYGTLMAEATWNGFRQNDPKARPFILTRSASTGIQQFAAVWTGDNASSWAHLRMSIPETLNLALSGVSFNGADIGGFMESTNAELLARWYQAAVLFPFYRNHSNNATAHQEPWCFGSGTRDIIREAINLRYRMLGAIYTEFCRHIETGEPLVRPLCYFSPDEKYRDVSDVYALGENLIVAPVVHQGASKRHILLPPGEWLDLTQRNWVEGGVIFERAVSMNDIPVFARRGTIVCEPVPDGGSYVGWDCDLTRVKWRLHCFGDSGRGEQAIDDGLTWVDAPPAVVSMSIENGNVSGSFPLDRVIEVVVHGGDAVQMAVGTKPMRRIDANDGIDLDDPASAVATLVRMRQPTACARFAR